jgi:polyketide synthase PksJ
MACRVPGASTLEEFWNNVLGGVESIAFLSPEELEAAGVPAASYRDPRYVPAGGFIEHAEEFDAALFGYTPREAALMDPQHRLLQECTWEALEHAGYGARDRQARFGVFAGVANSAYLQRNVRPTLDAADSAGAYQALISAERDFVATRLSYQLDLSGPSMNVQTACSTSLVAIHVACQSLLNGECDVAIAGGAAIALPQKAGYFYEEGLIVSPDGHCRAFAADAKGTVPGNGAGIVVLKRFDDAVADGDVIHAVVLGSAVNNDGAHKVGYTAPGVHGQANVIVEAQAVAGVPAETIGYIEAHGTGTPVGDPIEVAALKSAFLRTATSVGTCALGSVKSNIGHLDTAAGVVGFIKAVMAVEHGRIPPTLHAAAPNPALDIEQSPFYLPTSAREWRAEVRRAGVSAFGIGGTNAHVVIEQPPVRVASQEVSGPVMMPLSAKTAGALEAVSARLAAFLESSDAPLADVAYTLACGRRALPVRRIVICDTRDAAVAALRRAPVLSVEMPAIAKRWLAGEDVEWAAQFAGQRRVRVALPTYPFERQRCWIDPAPNPAVAKPTHRADIGAWLYAPGWQRTTPVASPTDHALRRERWFLCGADGPLRDAVRARLQKSSASLLPAIDNATAVLHFGSDYASVVGAAQTLAASVRPASFTMVSDASALVLGEEAADASGAPAMAVVRVLSQEHPEIRGRVVDLASVAGDSRLVDQVLGEAISGDRNAVVTYHGRHRWIPQFTPIDATPAGPAPGAGDMFLITGGAGRIGRTLAKHLCRRGANVVVVGRTPVAEPWMILADGDGDAVSLDLDAIGGADAHLLVVQADAADESQMRRAFDAAVERFGSVTVVIHAAGVAADATFQPIEELDDRSRVQHLRTKAEGAGVLRRLAPEYGVRTCVLMSSLSAVLGGLGFAAYAGANAAMDLVAQQEDGRDGIRWVSIGWDAWQFEGDGRMRAPIAARLVGSAIHPEEGVQVLDRILASNIRGHVLVSTTDLRTRAAQSVAPEAVEAATHGADVAAVITETWRQLLGIDVIGRDDDFYELGGNSLLATQAVSRLRRAFDIELSVRAHFDETTVSGLTRHIERLLVRTGAYAQ